MCYRETDTASWWKYCGLGELVYSSQQYWFISNWNEFWHESLPQVSFVDLRISSTTFVWTDLYEIPSWTMHANIITTFYQANVCVWFWTITRKSTTDVKYTDSLNAETLYESHEMIIKLFSSLMSVPIDGPADNVVEACSDSSFLTANFNLVRQFNPSTRVKPVFFTVRF